MFSEWSKPYTHLDDGQPRGNALLVKFRDGAEPSKKTAEVDGVPQYDRVIQMEIMALGQKTSAPIYEVSRRFPDGTTKDDKPLIQRFKTVYDAYVKNITPSADGLPLESWALMGDWAIARAFKDCNIHTVEQLADMSDAAHDAVHGPSRLWQTKAKAFLADAKEQGGDVKARADLAKANEQIEELKAQVKLLLQKSNSMGFDAPKKGKRRNADDDDMPVSLPNDAEVEFEGERL